MAEVSEEKKDKKPAEPGNIKNSKNKKDQEQLDPGKINVKIYSPFKIYFDGSAKSVSAENDTGPFDVLPKHHNFMTLLNAGEVVVRKDDGEQKYKIARGIMHVKKNAVVIFLDV